MKPVAILILSFLILSCSESEEAETLQLQDGLPQTWVLVSFNAGLSGEVFSGENLPYHESIRLNTDSTFTRTRVQDNESTTVSGTFEYGQISNDDFLILHNTEENDLIGNCTRSLEEWFVFQTPTNMLGGGLPCDRPGLGFERIE